MSSQTLYKLTIVWLALWFGVIVPGHKRGLVLLPGAPRPVKQTQSDKPCPLAGMMRSSGTCCPTSTPRNDRSPTAPGSHCAVCYLTGVLDVPDPIDLTPPPLELVEVLPWPKPVTVESVEHEHVYFGRGPPPALHA